MNIKSIVIILVSSILLSPALATAFELNISDHFKKLGGSSKDNNITPNTYRPSTGELNTLMKKYFIRKWDDEYISVEVGVSSNSLFLLITNKTQLYIQYKISVTENTDAASVSNQGTESWFDLLPNETRHLGGTPLFIKDIDAVTSLELSINSKQKTFKSTVEKKFIHIIKAEDELSIKKELSRLGDSVFSRTIIFPNYDKYRKNPTNNLMNQDLKKVDDILNIIETRRNRIGLTDVARYLNRSDNGRVFGIYNNEKKELLVTTGASIPNTSMIKFNNKIESGTNYYFFTEDVTDYKGQLVGAAYSVLFREKDGIFEVLFEKEDLGYVSLVRIDDLVVFPESIDLFVIAEQNNGVFNRRFVARLHNNNFLDDISISENDEEGHGPCPEYPFQQCG